LVNVQQTMPCCLVHVGLSGDGGTPLDRFGSGSVATCIAGVFANCAIKIVNNRNIEM